MDFKKYEKNIDIDSYSKIRIKNQLHEDINFLLKMHIMDYSLLIMKVDWRTQKDSNSCIGNQEFFKMKFPSIYQCVQSGYDDNVYYHFGLIDYL